MRKCRCGGALSLTIEDYATASLSCPAGHRTYLFRMDDGTWESQATRRRRMRKHRVCEKCAREYRLHDHSAGLSSVMVDSLCPECWCKLFERGGYKLLAVWKRRSREPRADTRRMLAIAPELNMCHG